MLDRNADDGLWGFGVAGATRNAVFLDYLGFETAVASSWRCSDLMRAGKCGVETGNMRLTCVGDGADN